MPPQQGLDQDCFRQPFPKTILKIALSSI